MQKSREIHPAPDFSLPQPLSKPVPDCTSTIVNTLLKFMGMDDVHAQHIIQSIDGAYQDVCGRSFAAYDPFAVFAFRVIKGEFTFVVKETAANILRHVATDINRYSAQYLVEELKNDGIEPMLEDILDS